MTGSQRAAIIDYDYKMKKKYETKRAKKCKDRECGECKLSEVCTESEEGEECGEVKMGTS